MSHSLTCRKSVEFQKVRDDISTETEATPAPTSSISSNVGDQMLTSILLNPLGDVTTIFKLLTSASISCVAAA